MQKKRLFFILKLIATGIAVGLLFYLIDLKSFFAAVSSANFGFLALVFLIGCAMPVINAIKIKLLLPGSVITIRYIVFTNCAAMFLRLTIPTDLGAELGRGYYFSRKTGSTATAFSAIVLDRYSGLFSQVLVFAAASLFFGVSNGSIFWIRFGAGAAAAAVLLAAFLIALAFVPAIRRSGRKGFVRITSALARFSEYAHQLRSMPLRAVVVAGISIGCHCLTLLMIMVTSAAYQVSLPFHEAAAISLSATISFVLPVTVGGLGIVEGIYTGLYVLFALQKEIGLAVSLTMRVMTMIMALPGALFVIYGERLIPAKRVGKAT
jgi:uncharacterized protein (TIRG00374 family)